MHRSKDFLFVPAAIAVVLITLGLWLMYFAQPEAAEEGLRVAGAVADPGVDRRRFAVPVTSSQPSQGPRDAAVTIVAWCDLRGQACRDADIAIAAVMARNVGLVRWVHRHQFDRTDKSALLINHVARAVAHHTEHFWKLREQLLRIPEDAVITEAALHDLVRDVGVDWNTIAAGFDRQGYAQHINADLLFGVRFGVNDDGAIFVNGRRLASSPQQSLHSRLQQLVNEELQVAQRTIERGVAPSEVYDEVTRDGLWSVDDDPSKRLRSEVTER